MRIERLLQLRDAVFINLEFGRRTAVDTIVDLSFELSKYSSRESCMFHSTILYEAKDKASYGAHIPESCVGNTAFSLRYVLSYIYSIV